ncbi:cytochrome P460 family protein [Dethiosulfatarculus sandiegensis]|uniref:Cytochrome P460 domain-containing protein n=1 Tax=Dethiosulfatarculus sandiegensis TaxID=1429043 RepID=A0A0D2J1X8_9BACT|nr:hypothetical protein [Dethiosulfatarculus sandiegensis]KIX12229.1 hypothetical protein X474_20960 [Dethiosulfatarculus sandiegensis]
MKRLGLILILVFCFGFCVYGLVWAISPMPGPNSNELWRHITKTDPYQKWGQWPDFKGLRSSNSPHGAYVKVYVNKIGLNIKNLPAAYGTIEVKEGYDGDKKLNNITVQYKVKGYNPDAGDWYWVKYNPKGEAGPAGKPGGCIRCHGADSGRDYILAHEFK